MAVGRRATSVRTLPPLKLVDSSSASNLEKIEAERARWLAELEKVKAIPKSVSAPVLPSAPPPAPTGPTPLQKLRSSLRRAVMLHQAAKSLSHPPPSLERQANQVWGGTLPEPVAQSAASFDERARQSRRQARLAMRAVRDEPNAPRAAEDFEQYLSELFWARYTLDAPVERGVEAYPDPVWGLPMDKMTSEMGYDRPRPSYAGIAFTGSPEKGKAPVRPRLPALRGETQRPTTHQLLPDSHYALGAFGGDDGLAYKRIAKEVYVKPWSLDDSIFRARKHGPSPCDSKDFWDSISCVDAAFAADWGTTTGAIVMAEIIANGKASTRSFGTTKLSGYHLTQIRDLLRSKYIELLSIFIFYASVDAGTSGSIYGITKIGYTILCRDAGMIGDPDAGEVDAGAMKVIDLTWIAVNESLVSKAQDYNAKGRLVRWELVEWAVRMAFERYGESGKAPPDKLVEAVSTFLNVEVAAAAKQTGSCFPPPNAYRDEVCYNESMDEILSKHGSTLRALFESYAYGEGDMHDKLNATTALAFDEWNLFLDDLQVIHLHKPPQTATSLPWQVSLP